MPFDTLGMTKPEDLAADKREPLEVELPVCPRCKRIGKIVGAGKGVQWKCTGPRKRLHKSTRMQMTRFREVRPGGG